MASRKSFLFRIDPQILEALRRWADDDLRSMNGQLEFIVRRALTEAGRLPKRNSTRESEKPKPNQEDQEPLD